MNNFRGFRLWPFCFEKLLILFTLHGVFPHLTSFIGIFQTSYLLSQTFIISNLFSVFSALSVTAFMNSFGISNATISKFYYVEFYYVPSALLRAVFHPLSRTFSFHSLEWQRIHSKTLIECLSFLFQHHSMLLKQKLNIKSLDER